MKIILNENGILPHIATDGSAGYDLYADIPGGILHIPIDGVVKISAGFKIYIEDSDYCGLILPRSGLATKYGVRPANTPGLIDSDYQGEVFVALRNEGKVGHIVKHGSRIAQLLITRAYFPVMETTDSFEPTGRGEGGFGSTG